MFKKKFLILAIIIILLIGICIIPSVNAEEKSVYVDQSIILKKSDLFILNFYLNKVENNNCKILLKEIINHLEKSRYINSNDIKEIINENNIDLKAVSTGLVIANGYSSDTEPQAIFSFPSFIIFQYLEYYIGPVLFMTWTFHQGKDKADDPLMDAIYRLNFGDYQYCNHSGIAIGGLSYIHKYNLEDYWYRIIGIFSLIIIY
jgi:hypothetical protein